jgi:hypothetical protein
MLTDAEILLDVTVRLARIRDWLAEEIDRAPAPSGSRLATLTLRRAKAETFRDGLGRAESLLDDLMVDPAQVRARADMAAVPAGERTLQ